MKITYLLVFLISLAIAGVGIAIKDYRQPSVYGHASAVERAEQNVETQLPTVGPIRNLRFTLFDAGIRPGAMRIKARLVNIHIEDRTNTSQGVTIQRVAGGERVAIGSVQKVATDLRGRSSFILAPGEYELFDVSKPANKAVLQVEP